jgi:hypothetical protein
MYLVAEFVTFPKKGKADRAKDSDLATDQATSAPEAEAEKSDSARRTVQPILTEVLSGSVTSSGVATPTNNASSTSTRIPMQEQIAKRVAQTVRSDGVGRITVPPVSRNEDMNWAKRVLTFSRG